MDNKKILDACCGSRMFWFNKENKNTVYMDNRTEEKLEDDAVEGETFHINDLVQEGKEND